MNSWKCSEYILIKKTGKRQNQGQSSSFYISSIQFDSILFAIKVLRFKVLIEKVIAK